MQTEGREELCARLCLLTRACWNDGLPAPLSRPVFWRMASMGAVCGLVLREVPEVKDAMYARMQRLLSRACSVYSLLEDYERRGYRALLPGDEGWPQALCALGGQMPPFLFMKGKASPADVPRYAVAGSRDIRADTLRAARRIGQRIAGEGAVLVTGGARGVDFAAQVGALEAGGQAMIVPAKAESDVLASVGTESALAAGKLVLLYDSLPDEPFSAVRALLRNHTVYALGNAAIVVAAREGVGGSWHGASDCLRGGWSPVLVCRDDCNRDMAGNRALLGLGARELREDRSLGAQLTGGRSGCADEPAGGIA